MRKNSKARPAMRAIFALLLVLSSKSWAMAQTFVVQGSTTFAHSIMDSHQAAIETDSCHKVIVFPNKTSLGLLALLDKRADFAMISGPFANEIALLRRDHPTLPFARLRKSPGWSTRMAFAV